MRLPRPQTQHLQLYRPATLDLLLTKMMRGGDAEDLEDIDFMIRRDGLRHAEIETAIAFAVVPEGEEVRELFESAKPAVLALARRISE